MQDRIQELSALLDAGAAERQSLVNSAKEIEARLAAATREAQNAKERLVALTNSNSQLQKQLEAAQVGDRERLAAKDAALRQLEQDLIAQRRQSVDTLAQERKEKDDLQARLKELAAQRQKLVDQAAEERSRLQTDLLKMKEEVTKDRAALEETVVKKSSSSSASVFPWLILGVCAVGGGAFAWANLRNK